MKVLDFDLLPGSVNFISGVFTEIKANTGILAAGNHVLT